MSSQKQRQLKIDDYEAKGFTGWVELFDEMQAKHQPEFPVVPTQTSAKELRQMQRDPNQTRIVRDTQGKLTYRLDK